MTGDNYQRIKTIARDMFLKYGIKGVSVDGISNALHISKKTFYNSYTNKKELLLQLTDEFLADLKTDLIRLKEHYQGLDLFLWSQYYFFIWISKFRGTLLTDLKTQHTIVAKYNSFKKRMLIVQLTNLLGSAKQANLLKERIDIVLFCQLQICNIEKMFEGRWDYMEDQRKTELFDQLVSCNLQGILNEAYAAQFELADFNLKMGSLKNSRQIFSNQLKSEAY